MNFKDIILELTEKYTLCPIIDLTLILKDIFNRTNEWIEYFEVNSRKNKNQKT